MISSGLEDSLSDCKRLLTERLLMSDEIVKSLTSQLAANKTQLDEALKVVEKQQQLLQAAQQPPTFNPFDDVVPPVYYIRRVVRLRLELPFDDDTLWSLVLLVDGIEVVPSMFRNAMVVENLTSPTVFGVSKKARRGVIKYQFRWTAPAASRNLVTRGAFFNFCLRGGSHSFTSKDFTIRVRQ